jgi:uncharacterized LabA/DUF88 family protein
MNNEEDRIALFLDFENLALGARDRGEPLDVGVIMDALSERGRIIIRRAYADWNLFSEHRQQLALGRIEMIEIPQRTGMVRKNAADIKLAVDTLELAFERAFITTFVIGSGDSDFTPLVLKLRELNKRVIGVGVEGSTSELLPGACDEFLFYGRLLGSGKGTPTRKAKKEQPQNNNDSSDDEASDLVQVARLITRTVAGLQGSSNGPVLSSMVKRVILRKDPTFSESDFGFRTWGELMQHLQTMKVVELNSGSAEGDPIVQFPQEGDGQADAFELLRDTVSELQERNGPPLLSGLKNELRKRRPDFSEKNFGYGGFLQFVKAARAKDMVDLKWDDDAEDYYLSV